MHSERSVLHGGEVVVEGTGFRGSLPGAQGAGDIPVEICERLDETLRMPCWKSSVRLGPRREVRAADVEQPLGSVHRHEPEAVRNLLIPVQPPLGPVDPEVEVVEQRFVEDGNVITSAGVSAGIDMALHLVDRLEGREVALGVQKVIEYYPEPPFSQEPVAIAGKETH